MSHASNLNELEPVSLKSDSSIATQVEEMGRSIVLGERRNFFVTFFLSLWIRVFLKERFSFYRKLSSLGYLNGEGENVLEKSWKILNI